jgi:hypothetical protein
VSILHVPVTASNLVEWVRRAAGAINQLITGKQDQSDNLDSIADLSLTGNAGDAIVVNATEDGFELVAGGGGGGTTTNPLTMNNGGAGAASGTTFDGSVARTISYNTVGAAASSHTHAQADVTGLTTADSPQFTAINLGHASDTTLTRVSAGVVAVEGVNVVTTAGGVTFAADISVPDEAYDATNWNGSVEVPTKNAIRDKIETLGAPARVLIAETVTTGSAANVQFASIAGTYRDLEVRVRGRGTTAATLVNIRMRFNGDSGGNYDHNDHQLNNTATAGFTSMAQTSAILGNLAAASATANYADFLMATVADYRGTTFQKAGHWKGSIRHSTTAASTFNEQGCFWWRNTAAITQVDVFPNAGGFVDGTVVSLYGLM